MDHPKPELKYVRAKELPGTGGKLGGADVEGMDGKPLGTVDGFIMDIRSGRPRHVVVAAGWFIHKHFLLPIGHVALSEDGGTLRADVARETVEGFPGFDKSEFDKLDADQVARLDQRMAQLAIGQNSGGPERHYSVPEGWV